ncbi:hypothetical protein QBC40DRAFT_71396 [Triangularia verruculosa]|uniref:Azaphilone pigments biosynthesis cluster protein L N-terminal domain-containing protein n=1 Tax=Triangularia verruculosa TaxID=2587418 RepID=A0AAN7ATB4_9PEZI|nr:hypothetical protein QBC40DRAFT_71396 [Triangularia verruculosa]
MSDPLSITAGILAIVTAACASAKGLFQLVDSLRNAPKAIKDLNEHIMDVQQVLKALESTLQDQPDALVRAFERVGLKESIGACRTITEDFAKTLRRYTTNSAKDGISHRRVSLTVTFRKSKIATFQARLKAAKETVQFAITSATLVTSSTLYATTENYQAALKAHEEAIRSQAKQLEKLENELIDLELDSAAEDDEENDIISVTTRERGVALAALVDLKHSCQKSLLVTEARSSNTYQKFGNVTAVDGLSRAGAGMAGSNFGDGKVHQEWKDTTASNGGQVFVGRMDNEAFRSFWGNQVR